MAEAPTDTDLDRKPAAAPEARALLASLKPASAAATPCKICGGAAAVYGAVDFHKSCEEWRGSRLPPAGVPITYRRCASCGFLFTDAFDDWSEARFSEHIYNAGYAAVDPDYQLSRPRGNAGLVDRLWGQYKDKLRVLDYGGGNGVLCNDLRVILGRSDDVALAASFRGETTQWRKRPTTPISTAIRPISSR